MSALISSSAVSTGMFAGIFNRNNDDIQPVEYRVSMPQMIGSASNQLRDVDVLWPRSSILGSDYSNIAPIWDNAHQYWEWNFPPTGTHVRKKVNGQVLDISNNPISGATVMLFNTSTGLIVDTQVTDSGGNYSCSDPNSVNCFAVAYLAGSPDTAGTTLDNLSGT